MCYSMTDKRETVLGFLFETKDLAKGRQIKKIQKDLRDYSLGKGFNLLPKIMQGSSIDYIDTLATTLEGEEYLDCWDFGMKLIAKSEIVRLYSLFRADGYDEFRKTKRFQAIHDDVIHYCIDQNLYLECANEHSTKPPIIVSMPHFDMHGPGEYSTIGVTLGGKVISYIQDKRKQYGEPGPEDRCDKFLEEQRRR